MTAPEGPRIVIVGGGFGGVYAAAYLAQSDLAFRGARVTLIDQRNYFTFQPLLAETVGGSLGREHVTYPLRVLARRYRFTFLQARVTRIVPDASLVCTAHGEIGYDYLLLATGAEPRYFGESLARHGLPLTSVTEAQQIRNRVITAMERAAVSTDPVERQRLKTVVVAGAGPAGVEVASEIHHLLRYELARYYPASEPCRVVLVDPSARILQGFDESLAEEGLQCLIRRGIEPRLGRRVLDADANGVTLAGEDGEERIPAATFVWTAGTAPTSPAFDPPLDLDRGAVRVLPTLQVAGHPAIYAVGDVTVLTDPRGSRPYPRVAPIAISQGIRAAGNIENAILGRPLEPYHAHHAGKIVSLGRGVALVDLLGFRVRGRLAWLSYRAAYLLKLVGLKNKVNVVLSLIMHRIFGPDIAADVPAPE